MTDHSITPPPELVQQWEEDWYHSKVKHVELLPYIAAQSAQYGADQELEACCEQINEWGGEVEAENLRTLRRSRPPSLKEQALLALSHLLDGAAHSMDTTEPADYIRRALESIKENND